MNEFILFTNHHSFTCSTVRIMYTIIISQCCEEEFLFLLKSFCKLYSSKLKNNSLGSYYYILTYHL